MASDQRVRRGAEMVINQTIETHDALVHINLRYFLLYGILTEFFG
jgi:hypothetical protein